MEKLSLENFLNYNNKKLAMFNPINKEKGSSLKSKIAVKVANEGWEGLVKYTTFDKVLNECVQHVYAYKNDVCTTEVIEVLRRFETYPTIWRSAWYRDTKSSLKIMGIYNAGKGRKFKAVHNNTEYWEVLDPEIESKLKFDIYEFNTISNIIKKDNRLQYCGYNKKSNMDMLDYIKLYRNKPIIEVPMKLGLFRLIENEKAIETIINNKAFRKWMCRNASECKDLSFLVMFNSFKKNPNASPKDYSNSLKYRIQCGKNLSAGLNEMYRLVLNYTTIERLQKYIDEQDATPSSYADYIKACVWLRLDLNDTKVLYPYDFYEMHDFYVEQYAIAHNPDYGLISDNMGKVADKYKSLEYSDETYSLIIAKNKTELLEESHILEHCVGYMGYDIRQAEEESLICFIRKNEAIDRPYCTLELNLRNYRVMQCYGKANSLVPEVDEFVDKWKQTIRKKLKENKIEQPIKKKSYDDIDDIIEED